MFTFEQYAMAFSTPAERDAFFARAENGQPVEPGTAFRHVLGTNLGVWGEEDGLRRDAARIIVHEVATWARRNNQPVLTLPAEAILAAPMFELAFRDCREPNRQEIDRLVEFKRETMSAPARNLADVLSSTWTQRLHISLLTAERGYQKEMQHHREQLSRVFRGNHYSR